MPDGSLVRVTFTDSREDGGPEFREAAATRTAPAHFVGAPASPDGDELLAKVKAGSRVTILTPHGQRRTGRAVMRSSYGGWVLNMGGAHGTPGLVDARNIVSVK